MESQLKGRRTDIVIIGTGGFGREVHQIIEDLSADGDPVNFIGFLDSNPGNIGREFHGCPVLGDLDWLAERPNVRYVLGIGSPSNRHSVSELVRSVTSSQTRTLVHPTAWIGNRVEVGQGTVVCAGVRATTDIHIGDFVIVNLNCTIGHDSVLEDYVTVAPSVNISGGVRVGQGCDLGTGGTIIQNVSIGPWSVTGGGAVVVSDLPEAVTAVGVPAKVISTRTPGWHLPQVAAGPGER